ncbi:MAG: hypothetical protein AAF085_00200 [Planctomycetota bacterium]
MLKSAACCLAAVCIFLASLPALAEKRACELEQRVTKELATFYKEGKPAPPWKAAVDAVAKGGQNSAASGAYLRALLAQAAADEASGEAPWRATPFWGHSGENPARDLRETIVESLAGHESLSDAATPALAWIIQHDNVPAFQSQAAKALQDTQGNAADQLIASLISSKTSNHAVLRLAIETAAQRPALRDHAQAIAQLATHHHKRVRETATRVAKGMDVEDLPDFDPVAAMRSESIVSLMAEMRNYLDLPPGNARFIRVTSSYPRDGGVPYVTTATGWEVQSDETWLQLFTPHGSTQRIRLKPDPDADPDHVHPDITVTEISITDEIDRIEALRAGGDDDFALSEEGGMTGQFEVRGASVYEAILGLWLHEAKRDKLAARIVLPALETLYSDKYLAEMVRQRMGRNLGRQMLVAFIGDRDFDTATRHAKRIAEHSPDTQFYGYAVKLAAELPKRRDDFKTFVLPTPGEWAELKQKLSRDEQIDYLCARLRLLNVYQFGQPGGISYSGTQWPTPQGLSADASWGGSTRRDEDGELINPYTELTSDIGWFHPDEQPKPVGMDLTVDDIPLLAEHLHEDWHILAVSFWRDFHPSRNLHTTREILVGIINDLAGDDLVDVEQLLNEQTTDAEIKRVQAWAAERKGRTRTDLKLDAIERVLANEGRYFDVRGQIASLVEAKEQRVVPMLIKFLDRDDIKKFDHEAVFAHLRKLDAPAGLPHARKQHGKGYLGARYVAALIELEAGDPEQAVKLLDAVLEEADYGNMSFGDLIDVIESLIETGRADAKQVVSKQFADDRLLQYSSYGGSLAGLVRRTAEMGDPGGLAIYRRQLDNETNKRANTTYGSKVSHRFADEFIEYYDRDDQGLMKIRNTTQPETDARVEALKRWLDDKINELSDKPD